MWQNWDDRCSKFPSAGCSSGRVAVVGIGKVVTRMLPVDNAFGLRDREKSGFWVSIQLPSADQNQVSNNGIGTAIGRRMLK